MVTVKGMTEQDVADLWTKSGITPVRGLIYGVRNGVRYACIKGVLCVSGVHPENQEEDDIWEALEIGYEGWLPYSGVLYPQEYIDFGARVATLVNPTNILEVEIGSQLREREVVTSGAV